MNEPDDDAVTMKSDGRWMTHVERLEMDVIKSCKLQEKIKTLSTLLTVHCQPAAISISRIE